MFSKLIHIVFVSPVENTSKWKPWPKISRRACLACILITRIQFTCVYTPRTHYATVEIHPYRDHLPKNLLKNLGAKVQKVHFRSTCIAQKLHCWNSLMAKKNPLNACSSTKSCVSISKSLRRAVALSLPLNPPSLPLVCALAYLYGVD